jgi:hypothetical protein
MTGILVSPVIGGRLASISVRGPYLAAGAAYFLQTATTLLCVPETLPRKRRKKFALSAASPLSVLALFRKGGKLRALATSVHKQSVCCGSDCWADAERLRVCTRMTALNELCNGRPLRMICDTQKDEVLRWTPTERGTFNTWSVHKVHPH